jgi:hypothetical protein
MLDTSLYWKPVPKSVGLSKNISVRPKSVKPDSEGTRVGGGFMGITEFEFFVIEREVAPTKRNHSLCQVPLHLEMPCSISEAETIHPAACSRRQTSRERSAEP